MADLELRQIHEDLERTNALLLQLLMLLQGDAEELGVIQTVNIGLITDDEVVTKE